MIVNRCVNKALGFGAENALNDLQRSGKSPTIRTQLFGLIRSFVESLKSLVFPTSCGPWIFWQNMPESSASNRGIQQGHPSLKQLARGTVSKILNKQEIRPHKIKYYLERRDPAFDSKFIQVLYFYKSVNFLLDTGLAELADTVFVSYDEKPGIQAIENTAPDLAPRPGKRPEIGRDYEYKRHGTVSLMAGIDLLTGHVHGRVVERNLSSEFIAFLQTLNMHYDKAKTIRVILDNHTIHTSAETQGYLATVPNRFEFVFTPKHGSWLNLVETFFSKMARSMLRAIRVKSKDELKNRIEQYLSELNESPVIFRWKYGLDLV
jgi:transposase